MTEGPLYRWDWTRLDECGLPTAVPVEPPKVAPSGQSAPVPDGGIGPEVDR